jgi:hypothetical protein
MLLRPPKPVTATIAHVRREGAAVTVTLDEKRDDFRDLLKAREFVWNWTCRRWERTIGDITGPPADRAAETAHLLLAAGFSVELSDELAQMVMDVAYAPEKRRLVMRRSRGDYAGWLVLKWPRDDAADRQLYAAYDRIPGRRYDKPNLVVPPDQYEAVRDFAERFGFWISPAAQGVIDAAEARVRAAVIFDPPPLPDARPHTLVMEIGIDPELADDDDAL